LMIELVDTHILGQLEEIDDEPITVAMLKQVRKEAEKEAAESRGGGDGGRADEGRGEAQEKMHRITSSLLGLTRATAASLRELPDTEKAHYDEAAVSALEGGVNAREHEMTGMGGLQLYPIGCELLYFSGLFGEPTEAEADDDDDDDAVMSDSGALPDDTRSRSPTFIPHPIVSMADALELRMRESGVYFASDKVKMRNLMAICMFYSRKLTSVVVATTGPLAASKANVPDYVLPDYTTINAKITLAKIVLTNPVLCPTKKDAIMALQIRRR